LATFPQKNYLSLHPLPRDLNHVPTVLAWRKGAQSPKISALIEVLGAKASRKTENKTRRKKT